MYRVSFSFRGLLLAALIFLIGGCGEFDSTAEGGNSGKPSLSSHSFSNEVQFKLIVPSTHGEQEIYNEASLRRALENPETWAPSVLKQGYGGNFPYAWQLLNLDDTLFAVNLSSSQLPDAKAFNTKSDNIEGFGMKGLSVPNVRLTPSGTVTYRYFPPVEPGQLTLVSGEDFFLVADSSDPITVTINYSYREESENRLVDVDVFVNGQSFLSADNLRMATEGAASGLFPFTPYFGSTSSGDCRIEMEGSDGSSSWLEYVQRGLVFESEHLSYEVEAGESVTFSNSLAWDYGTNPGVLEEASWDIEITNPDGSLVETLSGQGASINAVWDTTSIGENIRLQNGAAVQDDGTPIYSYRIKARALAYPEFLPGTEFYRPVSFYEIESSEQARQIKFINAEFSPDPPFENEGDSVELTLEILVVGYGDISDEDVQWWVDLVGPDGKTVGDPLAMGTGFEVAATWDGRVDGVAVPNPRFYSFQVRAEVCSSDINPQRADILAQITECGRVADNYGFGAPRMFVSATVLEEADPVNDPLGLFEAADGKVGLGVAPEDIEDMNFIRAPLLEDIHYIVKSPDGGYDVDIEVVAAFQGDVEPPDPLVLQARNMLTGVVRDINADQVRTADGVAQYKAEDVNLPQEFIDADTPSGGLAGTRYSIGEFYRSNAKRNPSGGSPIPGKRGEAGVSSGVTEAFVSLMNNSGAFSAPRSYLGRFAETVIVAEEREDLYPEGAVAPLTPPENVPSDNPDQSLELARTVSSNPRNLISPGFVSIEFTIKETDAETDNRNPQELTPVYVKVPRVPGDATTPGRLPEPSPRGPNVLLWTFHGDDQFGGTLHPSEDYDRSVPDIKKKNWVIDPSQQIVAERLEHVQTLIITGCNALVLKDFNNGFTKPGGVDQVNRVYLDWPGFAERNYSGELWDKAMSTATKDGAVILGYNNVAPLINNDSSNPVTRIAEVIQLYEQELTALSGLVESSQLRQLAWMSANVKFADRATSKGDPRWLTLHAAAIDANYYYYIPQEKDRANWIPPEDDPTKMVVYETPFDSVQKYTPVYRIPRLAAPGGWGVTDPAVLDLGSWVFNRNNFAVPVPIPGLIYSQGGNRQ